MIERAEEGQEDSRNKSTNSRNPCYLPLAWQIPLALPETKYGGLLVARTTRIPAHTPTWDFHIVFLILFLSQVVPDNLQKNNLKKRSKEWVSVQP